jgi:3-oxoacyl-[acyl-carrier-protein] synthase-3
MMRAAITATGHYVPPDVYPNAYFERHLDTTDAWIRSRTGIAERRFASAGGTSDLIVPAARRCLDARGISPAAVDCVIVATMTPDRLCPSTAAVVQRKLAAIHAWGFDLAAACSGFVYRAHRGDQAHRVGCRAPGVALWGGSDEHCRQCRGSRYCRTLR